MSRVETQRDAAHLAEHRILKRIAARSAVVAVLGLGFVGLPLCLRFAAAGFRVLGLDTDRDKVNGLRRGETSIRSVDLTGLEAAVRSGRFEAGNDPSRVSGADAIILCVPTPLSRHREPDLSFIVEAVESILPHLRAGQLLVLESTTYPGTTEEEIGRRLENAGWRIGEDVFLAYSPEREDPGNPVYHTANIPKLCSGATPACLRVSRALYESAVDRVVAVSSMRVAELTKLLENVYRAVNIALVNELKVVAGRMGIDIFEVIRAAATKPFGYTPFYPGPGLGGHCIPIDPFYLTWKAREYGVSTRFIELAGEINTAMPDYVVSCLMAALNQHGKSVSQSRVLLLGASYKKNVGDVRESPGVALIEKLRTLGAEVAYSDPHVPVLPGTREHDLHLESVPLDEPALGCFDCVLVVTDHDDFDWDLIRRKARLIVDTRGVFETDGRRIFRA